MSSSQNSSSKASKKQSIRVPPELARQLLRGTSGEPNSDAEMKALMNMFADLLSMRPGDELPPEHAASMYMFSSSMNAGGASGSHPPAIPEALAAAASGMFSSTQGQWTFDYYDDDEEDDEDYEEEQDDEDHASSSQQQQEEQDAADAMARQVAQEETEEEQEKARKAAKRREKKLRKKEKAREEAALKAQETAQKKRAKQIQSWKSRVIAACRSTEIYKMQGLLQESPLKHEEQPELHLELLLPHCIAESSMTDDQSSPRNMLAAYICKMSLSVVFSFGKNGRNALHTACFTRDCYFVQLVVQQVSESQQVVPEKPLDLLCRDSGWAPLHYAVMSGSMDAMELLLAGGCNVTTCTDDAQTCRASDGHGITARELAEIVVSGKSHDEIETQGDALQEALDLYSSRTERPAFLRILRKMAQRLEHVETSGYHAPQSPNVDADVDVVEEHSNAKKRKGKKKKKAAAPANKKTEQKQRDSVDPPVAYVKQVEKDPLVVALLGMGFTEAQIHEAAKACGGLQKATADQMVMWILGGGEEVTSESVAEQNEASNDDTADATDESFIAADEKPTKRAAQQAQANEEAVKREQEKRAAAERLAAKKEEQRRRNREWNNREQARQREEMERRARQEAQRLAQERAKLQQRRVSSEERPAQQERAKGQKHNASVPTLVGRTVEVSSKPKHHAPKMPTKILQRPSQAAAMQQSQGTAHVPEPTHTRGTSMPAMGTSHEANFADSNLMAYGSMGYGHGEFDVSSCNSVASGGSGRYSAGAHEYAPNPMYAQRPPPNVPPPGFGSAAGVMESGGYAGMNANEGAVDTLEESSNPGEIRATAKAFVPTSFKPTPPPPRGMVPTTSAPASLPAAAAGRSRVNSLPSMDEANAVSGNDPLSSLLSSAAAHGMALASDRPTTLTPSATDSPVPSATSSSVTGITSTEDPGLNAVIGGFDVDGSSARSSLYDPLSLATGSGGMETSQAVAGSSIWGGSSSLASGPSLTGFSGLGKGDTNAPQASQAGGSGVGNADSSTSGWNSASFTQQRGSSHGMGSIW